MLKPYVCVVCEKVITAKDDVPSLINLFSKLIVTGPTEAQIPSNAVVPREWAVFSIWETEPGDEHRDYMLCTQVFYPDKSLFAEANKTKINIEPEKRAQMTIQFQGFPIGQVGEYTVRTWIEENQQQVYGPIEFGIGLEIRRQDLTQTPQTSPS
jgi:hypothetical protein